MSKFKCFTPIDAGRNKFVVHDTGSGRTHIIRLDGRIEVNIGPALRSLQAYVDIGQRSTVTVCAVNRWLKKKRPDRASIQALLEPFDAPR